VVFLDTLNKILYLLKRNGLSEAEFARQLNMSRSNITDWKTGRTKSYNKRLDKIAEVLKVSVDDLLNDASNLIGYSNNNSNTSSNYTLSIVNTNNQGNMQDQIILSDEEKKLINNYRNLDDEGKINVNYNVYYELRRMKQEGDKARA